MKYWVVAAILIGNSILQSALLPFLEIMGVKPDTLLVLVTCFGLLGGSVFGGAAGLFGGLLQDILYGDMIGLHALQYMIIGTLVGLLHDRIIPGKFVIPTLLVFCGSLLRNVILMGPYLYFTRAGNLLEYGFRQVILPEAVLTALCMPLIFYPMTLLFRKRFITKKWHFRRK